MPGAPPRGDGLICGWMDSWAAATACIHPGHVCQGEALVLPPYFPLPCLAACVSMCVRGGGGVLLPLPVSTLDMYVKVRRFIRRPTSLVRCSVYMCWQRVVDTLLFVKEY
jgi:hypothetical protein